MESQQLLSNFLPSSRQTPTCDASPPEATSAESPGESGPQAVGPEEMCVCVHVRVCASLGGHVRPCKDIKAMVQVCIDRYKYCNTDSKWLSTGKYFNPCKYAVTHVMHVCKYVCMNGWMDGWMDGWM